MENKIGDIAKYRDGVKGFINYCEDFLCITPTKEQIELTKQMMGEKRQNYPVACISRRR